MPIAIGLLLVAVVAVLAAGPLGLVSGTAQPTTPPVASATAIADRTVGPVGPSPSDGDTSADPTPAPTAEPTPSTPAAIVDVPIVPVTSFRSTATSVSAKDVDAVLAGTSGRFDGLALVGGDSTAILDALGVHAAAQPKVVLFDDLP